MLDSIRYYSCLLLPALVIAGFQLDMPWLGLASYPAIILIDFLLPLDTAARNIKSPFLARLPLYLFTLILTPLMYIAFFIFMKSSLDAGTLTWSVALGAALSVAWVNILPNVPVFHELGHGKGRFDLFLSYAGCILVGNMSRMITHGHAHHLYASTVNDPDTPRRGESIYTFCVRATLNNWKEILRMDGKRLKGKGILSIFRSWFLMSILVQVAIMGSTYYFFGGIITASLAGAIFGAMVFIEAFNFLQHYGLVRHPDKPMEARHVWNHLQAATRAVAYDITNHTPHHMVGDSPFQKNIPDPTAPAMISPLFILALALIAPPLWTMLIAKPKLKDWDLNYASPEEKVMAREANHQAGWPDWLEEETSGEALTPGVA